MRNSAWISAAIAFFASFASFASFTYSITGSSQQVARDLPFVPTCMTSRLP